MLSEPVALAVIAGVAACEQPARRNADLLEGEVIRAPADVDLARSESPALEVREPTRGERAALVDRPLTGRRSQDVEVEVADDPTSVHALRIRAGPEEAQLLRTPEGEAHRKLRVPLAHDAGDLEHGRDAGRVVVDARPDEDGVEVSADQQHAASAGLGVCDDVLRGRAAPLGHELQLHDRGR